MKLSSTLSWFGRKPDQPVKKQVDARVAQLHTNMMAGINEKTDQMFAVLLVLEWIACVCLAIWFTPGICTAVPGILPYRVETALLVGALMTLPALGLIWLRPGKALTRHVIAISQMIASALLIHVTGGRRETHFHVFGSLAFLAFYRDWPVLITASVLVGLEHLVRGIYYPVSVFGTVIVNNWRWVEHAGWVIFEDIFLIYSCVRSQNFILENASQRVQLERTQESIERTVEERTRELAETNIRLRANIEERVRAEKDLFSAKEAADAANRAKSEFLANMSHEIRTPMNGVMGMTILLQETQLSEQQRDFTETIRQSCDSLLVVINDILDFSKVESNNVEIAEIDFDLRSCIEDTLDLLAPRSSAKRLDLAYLMDEAVPTQVAGDPARLRQILVNLLGNGLKFTENGHVFLSVSSRPLGQAEPRASAPQEIWHEVLFRIQDTGVGIAPSDFDRLFKPFSQADGSMSRRYGGTGLGLAISKRLAEVMGGGIWFESELGKGSTFSFSVRLRSADSAAINPEPQTLHGKSLLLVESDPMTERVILEHAKRWGIKTHRANSLIAAETALRENLRPDAVLISTQCTKVPEVTEEIDPLQALSEFPDVPRIWMRDASDIASSENTENNTPVHIRKPIRPQVLWRTLVSSLGAKTASPMAKAAPKKTAKLAHEFPLKLLLVEDNAVNQKVTSRFLEALGYSCDVTENGQLAYDANLRENYDVVLMDLQMPVLDGYQATRLIRENPAATHQPQIIALTAHASTQDRLLCLSSGMDDYMTKPLSLPMLTQKLRESAFRLGKLPALS
ncbi:MAG TPA: ATP-binding protein [Opitutaceae bacterium]|nr:ATP-binding protein [Opitutaceae bacterium]